MAYNHRKAEIEWLNWKEKEEKQMRELGMDEDTIQRLHTYDWQQFKAERNFYEWQSFTDEDVEEIPETAARELKNIDDLLNSIENQKVFEVLKKVDKLTLKILLMRMEGYSDSEIAHAVGLDKYAVSMRIYRLRKKLKIFLMCVIFCPFPLAIR